MTRLDSYKHRGWTNNSHGRQIDTFYFKLVSGETRAGNAVYHIPKYPISFFITLGLFTLLSYLISSKLETQLAFCRNYMTANASFLSTNQTAKVLGCFSDEMASLFLLSFLLIHHSVVINAMQDSALYRNALARFSVHAGDFFGHMRPKSFISLGFYRSQLKLCSKTKLFLLYNLADLDF